MRSDRSGLLLCGEIIHPFLHHVVSRGARCDAYVFSATLRTGNSHVSAEVVELENANVFLRSKPQMWCPDFLLCVLQNYRHDGTSCWSSMFFFWTCDEVLLQVRGDTIHCME